MPISRRPASRPRSLRFMSMVVSRGRVASAMISQLSKPTIATAAGTEQLGHRFAAPAFRPHAGEIEAFGLIEPGMAERLAIAVAAKPDRFEALGTGDMSDVPAAEPSQMRGCESGSALIIGKKAKG